MCCFWPPHDSGMIMPGLYKVILYFPWTHRAGSAIKICFPDVVVVGWDVLRPV